MGQAQSRVIDDEQHPARRIEPGVRVRIVIIKWQMSSVYALAGAGGGEVLLPLRAGACPEIHCTDPAWAQALANACRSQESFWSSSLENSAHVVDSKILQPP